MAKNNNLGDFLTDIANAIREKKGTGETIPAQDFSDEILSIPSGGANTPYLIYDKNEPLNWSWAYYIYSQSDALEKLPNAWQDSLEVDISEIEKASTSTTQYGKLQYPDGELFGVIIPSGTTSIGNSGFYGWTSNNQPLVIPNSVTSIGSLAFENWFSNNHPLVIPNSVTSIGNSGFYNWTSNNHPLVIPNSVTSIGNSAFSYWTSNNHPLVIPNSVTSIGNSAFSYWKSNDQPLVIPNSVTSIGSLAFYNWFSNNHPLVIPNSVTSIGMLAFSGWELVPYVEIQAIIPPSLSNSNAFNSQNDATIYVPDASVDDYKTATNWVDLASRIKPISEKP